MVKVLLCAISPLSGIIGRNEKGRGERENRHPAAQTATSHRVALLRFLKTGRFVVTFPDFGWGATDGAAREEALDEAKDLLRKLIATTIREGQALPEPSRAGSSAL